MLDQLAIPRRIELRDMPLRLGQVLLTHATVACIASVLQRHHGGIGALAACGRQRRRNAEPLRQPHPNTTARRCAGSRLNVETRTALVRL
jgi:hypothetical protein